MLFALLIAYKVINPWSLHWRHTELWPLQKNTVFSIPPCWESRLGKEKEKNYQHTHLFCFLCEVNYTTRLYRMSTRHCGFFVWLKPMRPLWVKPQPDLRGFAGKVLCCPLWQNKFFIMIPYAVCVPLTVFNQLESHRIMKAALIHWPFTFKDTGVWFFHSETSRNVSAKKRRR